MLNYVSRTKSRPLQGFESRFHRLPTDLCSRSGDVGRFLSDFRFAVIEFGHFENLPKEPTDFDEQF